MAIGHEGFEGHPIGTIFVLGDSTAVMEHSKQLTTEYKYEYSRDKYEGVALSEPPFTKTQGVALDTNRFDWIATWRPTDGLTRGFGRVASG